MAQMKAIQRTSTTALGKREKNGKLSKDLFDLIGGDGERACPIRTHMPLLLFSRRKLARVVFSAMAFCFSIHSHGRMWNNPGEPFLRTIDTKIQSQSSSATLLPFAFGMRNLRVKGITTLRSDWKHLTFNHVRNV